MPQSTQDRPPLGFKRSLQLLPSPKLLSCCVRNVPPKQKAFLLLPGFYIWMKIAYKSGGQGGGPLLAGARVWGAASPCGSGLRSVVPGPRELCSFDSANPYNRHSLVLRKEQGIGVFPRVEALLLSESGIGRTQTSHFSRPLRHCNKRTFLYPSPFFG